MTLVKFTDWAAVREEVACGRVVYYHAPLDYSAVLVACRLFKNGKIRVTARDCSFTADEGHLDRFRKREVQPYDHSTG